MSSEVAAALIAVAGVGLTAAISVWQTRKTLKENANLAAEAARDQGRLAAGTGLLPARTAAYSELWSLLDVGPPERPKGLDEPDDRRRLADAMSAWYYPHGLLLSGGAQEQWRYCRDELRKDPDSVRSPTELHKDISLLRSWLKADLLVRDVEEVSLAVRAVRARTPTRPSADDTPSG